MGSRSAELQDSKWSGNSNTTTTWEETWWEYWLSLRSGDHTLLQGVVGKCRFRPLFTLASLSGLISLDALDLLRWIRMSDIFRSGLRGLCAGKGSWDWAGLDWIGPSAVCISFVYNVSHGPRWLGFIRLAGSFLVCWTTNIDRTFLQKFDWNSCSLKIGWVWCLLLRLWMAWLCDSRWVRLRRTLWLVPPIFINTGLLGNSACLLIHRVRVPMMYMERAFSNILLPSLPSLPS